MSDGTARITPIESAPFEITYADYAALLNARPYYKVRGRYGHIIIWVACIINFACSVFFLTFKDEPVLSPLWLNYANAGVAALFLFLSYGLRPILYRRYYKASRVGNGPNLILIDDEKIHAERGKISSDVALEELTGWTETGEYFFLWISKLQGFIVPKRAISAPGTDRLRTLLTQKGIHFHGSK